MDDNSKNKVYEWFASGNAHSLFPAELKEGYFVCADGSKLNIPTESNPFATTWGKHDALLLLDETSKSVPVSIMIKWFSTVENKSYTVAEDLPQTKMEESLSEINETTKRQKYDHIIAGMAPYGRLAIWLSGPGITTEVAWLKSKDANETSQQQGVPNPTLFEQYMQKFNYRITPKFETAAALEKTELFYYNGELNTTNSGEHAENAMRAKPCKIALHWRIEKVQYSGYFWTDEKKIIETFAKFYNNDAQKEGELIIEIGESNKEFKFSLQDKFTTIEIPVEEMEILVFKNKFEFFRSENYNKPPQGWRN